MSSFSLAVHPDRPLIIAHRGANHTTPENTLAAFRSAFQQGADGIELDVKLTADDQVVVCHDRTVDRTTDGHGPLQQFRLAELKELDAGSWFDHAYAGERIPTLAEVFEAFGSSILYDIELTNYRSPLDELSIKVAKLVTDARLLGSVMVTSFLSFALARFKQILPDVPAGLIALKGLAGGLTRSALGRRLAGQAVIPYYTDLTPEYIQSQARYGRVVIPWTVNEVDVIRRMIEWGAGAVITDVPDIARRALEAA